MKSIGLIGGIAPESTVEYYRTLIAVHRQRTNGVYPSILINSIDLTKLLALAGANEREELAAYVLAELERLALAGVTLGLLASNTPHLVFDEVRARSPIPLVSIVETAAAKASELGLSRLALFGTRFTMQSTFYRDVFARRGLTIVLPTSEEMETIHSRYMNELINAQFLDTTRAELLAIVDRMQRDDAIDAVILGGTELPLLLRAPSHAGVPLLDTMRIHVEAVIDVFLSA
ncbi:MAG TPA: amino acid racemase [Thermoanaerobaculia bacterium]|nr:amino acid racemase [Thermoanaerobaculia bacterium]